MKIILYGEAQIKGTGAWCYAEAIKEKGHELFLYRNDTFLETYSSSFFWKLVRRINRRSVLGIHQKRHFKGLLHLAQINLPEIIIILKGIHLGKEDIQGLKKYSSFVININHDDFFSHNKNNRSKRQFEAIPDYDYIFTTRTVNVNEVKLFNRRTDFFKFAYYPEIHSIPLLSNEEKQKYSADVLFVGTYERHRAAMLEKLMMQQDFDLAIYGNDWHKLKRKSILHKYIRSYKGLWMENMAKAIACAKITLGFLRKENRDEYTQRSFEVPACGGLLLAERSNFHKFLFKEEKEAVFFDADNINELKNKISFLLENENQANQIRKAGHTKVVTGDFSYYDRINQLMERFHEFHR